VTSPLPPNLAVRRIPAVLCDLLNQHEESPFRGLIRRPSTAQGDRERAVVTDTVVVKMIEESLTQASGCLYPYRNIATGEYDQAGIWRVLTTYWISVREVFPEAWAKPPDQSRLMHGVGIRAMGKLMDRIMNTLDVRGKEAKKLVKR